MKRNAIAIFLAAFLLIVFAVQCRIPCLTAALTVRTGEHEIYRFAACLIAHGSATHVLVNSTALIILLYGFGRRTSAFLIIHALPAALCAVWLYANSLMPDRAWLCGASPLIYALFGLIAWRERKTSVFSLFGIRCLSLPPIPMLGIVLLTDALFSKAFFSFIAWPVHTLAGLGGLITGMLLSFKPLRNPRYATAAIFIAAALAVLLSSGCTSQPKRYPFLRAEIPHTCREAIRFYFAQYRDGQIDLQDLESLCLMCDDVREMQLLEEIGKLKLTQGETP
jgi:membrane associated rhomboid family serine protease